MFGIGSVARVFGLDLGNTVNNVASGLFGNSIAGKGLGAIAGGLTAGLTGDPIGMFQQAGKLFGSITQGLGALFQPQPGHIGGGSSFPQLPAAPGFGGPGLGVPFMGGGMPGMGGIGGMGGMGGLGGGIMGGGGNSGLSAAGSALNQMGGLRNQMNSIMNNPNMSPEQKQFAMMQLQEQMQIISQLLQMISKIMQNQHNIASAIIGNMPSR